MQLYQEYVQLKALSGSPAPDPTIDTLDDLANLMTEIRSLSQFVQSATPSTLGVATGDTPPSVELRGQRPYAGRCRCRDRRLKRSYRGGDQRIRQSWQDARRHMERSENRY